MTDEYDVDEFLAHYGVKGMRWGVRRQAKRDANEFAKAKMYYGEGAGNRRKLIKAKVEERSKDPDYKTTFDGHLSNQNMAKRSTQAKRTRVATDVRNTTTKTARGVINILNGNPMAASAVAVGVVAAASAAHKSGVDKILLKTGEKAYSTIVNEMRMRQQSKTWSYS